MRDSDWEILHALHCTPNLTRAAEQLFMTQPSLTKRLQHMEEELGVTIVERGPKGLRFTREGEFLAQRAAEQLRFMNELRAQLKAMQAEAGQNIVVGSSYTFSKSELPELLARYRLRHPEVRFTVVTEQSNVLFRKVLDSEVDAAILRGDYTGPVEQTCIGADPGYLISQRPLTDTELLASTRLAYKTNDRTRELLSGWWAGRFGTSLPDGMDVGYIDVALQLAAKGLGWMLCFLPEGRQASDGLCRTPLLRPDGTPLVRRTWLVRPRQARPAAAQEFIRYVEQEYAAP